MTKLSYSSYARYRNCPTLYLLNLTEPRLPPTPEMLMGTIIQSIFEDFVNKSIFDREDLLQIVPSKIDKHSAKALMALSQEQKDKIIEAVKISYPYFEGIIGQGYESEVTLKSELEGMILEGRLDFISKKNGLILDGKASSTIGAYVDYDQLTFYAYLFYRNFGFIPKTAFLYYYQGELREVYQNQKRVLAFRDKVIQVIRQIKREQFNDRNKGWHCNGCPEQKTCPVYAFNEKEPMKIGTGENLEVIGL